MLRKSQLPRRPSGPAGAASGSGSWEVRARFLRPGFLCRRPHRAVGQSFPHIQMGDEVLRSSDRKSGGVAQFHLPAVFAIEPDRENRSSTSNVGSLPSGATHRRIDPWNSHATPSVSIFLTGAVTPASPLSGTFATGSRIHASRSTTNRRLSLREETHFPSR